MAFRAFAAQANRSLQFSPMFATTAPRLRLSAWPVRHLSGAASVQVFYAKDQPLKSQSIQLPDVKGVLHKRVCGCMLCVLQIMRC